MNRKALVALRAVATVGKVVAALILAIMLAKSSGQGSPKSAQLPLKDEFDSSLGKSETQSKNNQTYTSQNHNYGRNR